MDLFNVRITYKADNKMSSAGYFDKTVPHKQKLAGFKKETVVNYSQLSCSVIDVDYYTQHFGFFCKKELLIEQVTKIPLRFRLGSLQYNDYLEQKPNAVAPY